MRRGADNILVVADRTWNTFERAWGKENRVFSGSDWEKLRASLVAFADALPRRLRVWVRLGTAVADALDPHLGGHAALAAVPALEHQLSEILPHRLLDGLSPNCSGFTIEQVADLHAEIVRRLSTRHPLVADDVRPGKEGFSKEARALAMLVTNPEMSDTEIARRVGCNRTSLYRMRRFQGAKRARASGKQDRPRGRRVVDREGKGNVEGVAEAPKE
jgi:hypothetical protein